MGVLSVFFFDVAVSDIRLGVGLAVRQSASYSSDAETQEQSK